MAKVSRLLSSTWSSLLYPFRRWEARRWARSLCSKLDKGNALGGATMITKLFHPDMSDEDTRRCSAMSVGAANLDLGDARLVLDAVLAGNIMGAMARLEGLGYEVEREERGGRG